MATNGKNLIDEDDITLARDYAVILNKITDATKRAAGMNRFRAEAEMKLMDAVEKQTKLGKARLEMLSTEAIISQKIAAGGTIKAADQAIDAERFVKAVKALKDVEMEQLKAAAATQKHRERLESAINSIDKRIGGVIGKFKSLSNLLELGPEIVLISIFASIVESIVKTFINLDEAAAEFRKSMGMVREDSANIESMARNITLNYWKLGITAKDVYESIKSISVSLGSTEYATQGVVENMAIFQAQLGIATKTSADVLKTLAMISGTTIDSQKNMLYFAQHMSAAAGVPLDAVMEDVAQASANSYQFISRSPLELIKAAVEAKRMGTSLVSATQSASNLLDFTKSVGEEMEASVLVGKSINLQHARELAYRRDIRGLNQEILRIAKQTNFANLDPFQQNAVAQALGKSAGELMTMVQSANEHDNLMRHMTEEQRAQYDNYQKILNANQDTAKSMEEQAKDQLTSISNQAALKSISLAWGSIMANIGKMILPSIAVVLTGIAKTLNFFSDNATQLFSMWGSWLVLWRWVVAYMGKTQIYLRTIGTYTTMVGTTIGSWYNGIKSFVTGLAIVQKYTTPVMAYFRLIGMQVSKVARLLGVSGKYLSMFGRVAEVAGFFGKWLTPIGWAITSIMLIVNLVKEFEKTTFVKGDWLGNIGRGIAAIGMAIYDTLLKPFVDVFEWVWKHLCGHSPSEIGMGILDGIKSIGTLLIDALLSPYLTAWKLIKEIPFVSHFFGDKHIAVHPHTAVATVAERAKSDIDLRKTTQASNKQEDSNDAIVKKMSAMVDAINGLRDDMKNGKLNAVVYLDSQKLDSAIGRRLSYTGHLT